MQRTGFLRLSQIVGQKEVSPAEAAKNRERGKGPRTPRPAVPPIVPVSAATWWNGVKSGRFPQPVKLGKGITVWRSSDIEDLVENGIDLNGAE
ncbi:MAG: AlpA family phage regulatory protein [Deltaproteobacteria bacterium]|nr:AlpA family phage regulatory protein [Deltaproteobacteria bacterium]